MFALSWTAAAAQCSQAALPVTASEGSISSSPDASAGGALHRSSSDTPDQVRFATGRAVTVLEDTPLQVMNDMPISSRSSREGARLSFTVTRDVVVGGVLIIPCGATVFGTVVSAKQAGRLVGASNLTLQLTALSLDGRSYPLYTPPFKVVGQSKTRPTVHKAATGAAVGALLGEASMPPPRTITWEDGSTHPYRQVERITAKQRAEGDAVFAGVGAGVGLAIAASTPPSIAVIPAESEMEFTLASPIAVYPVDPRTAARLAQGMRPGGPVLYVRGENQ
jgi:hypothetical protein